MVSSAVLNDQANNSAGSFMETLILCCSNAKHLCKYEVVYADCCIIRYIHLSLLTEPWAGEDQGSVFWSAIIHSFIQSLNKHSLSIDLVPTTIDENTDRKKAEFLALRTFSLVGEDKWVNK